MAPKPISARRLAANRANASRSTGPRTPQGKTRSSQNARKHGLTASTFAVVQSEEPDQSDGLRAGAIAVYQPATAEELFAVERIALAQQALRRCAALEAGLFTAALNEATVPPLSEALTHDIDVTSGQDFSYRLAVGFEHLVQKSDAFKLFLRYQAQSERLYRRAIEEFDRLKCLRTEIPNEPTTITPVASAVSKSQDHAEASVLPAGHQAELSRVATTPAAADLGHRVSHPSALSAPSALSGFDFVLSSASLRLSGDIPLPISAATPADSLEAA